MTKKNKSIENELKQVRGCLKDKDERIGVLETSLVYLRKRREDSIRWFNFLCIVGFTVAMAVLVGVCYWFYPDWFIDIAGHVAIIGTMVMVINFLICACSLLFEKEDNDIGFWLFGFNLVGIPIIAGCYVYILIIFNAY